MAGSVVALGNLFRRGGFGLGGVCLGLFGGGIGVCLGLGLGVLGVGNVIPQTLVFGDIIQRTYLTVMTGNFGGNERINLGLVATLAKVVGNAGRLNNGLAEQSAFRLAGCNDAD